MPRRARRPAAPALPRLPARARPRAHVHLRRAARPLRPRRRLRDPRAALGYDLDCSARPLGGLPALCTPAGTAGWQALPRGVDDAFFQRILQPIYAAETPSRPFDLDAAVSSALEQGLYGLLVSVDRWNGALDDDDVEVSVVTSPGLAGGVAPAWKGADAWLAFPDVDADGTRPFHLERARGYVSHGTLVADARAQGAAAFRFGPPGLAFELIVEDLSLTADLSPGALARLTFTGTIDLPSARAAAAALPGQIAGCADYPATAFAGALAEHVETAADMPSDLGSSPADPCDAISFAWAFDAEPAALGGEAGPSDAGSACP